MTPAGWVFMTSSVGFVLALVVFCFIRVLRPPAAPTSDPESPGPGRGRPVP